MSQIITNQESFRTDAQELQGPRDPRLPADINTAKVTNNIEPDNAPAVSSPPERELTRRSMLMDIALRTLAGAAIAPAAAAVIVAGPDPIFAAIKEYKRSWREYADADEAVSEASFLGRERSGRSREEWPAWCKEDPEGFIACGEQAIPGELAHRRCVAKEAYDDAIDGIASTIPTTLAGVAAMVTFYIDDDPEWAAAWHEDAMRNLAKALKRLAAA